MTRFLALGDQNRCISYVDLTRFQNLVCNNEIYHVKFKTALWYQKNILHCECCLFWYVTIACAALGAGNACNCGRLRWKMLMGSVMTIYDVLNVNNLEINGIIQSVMWLRGMKCQRSILSKIKVLVAPQSLISGGISSFKALSYLLDLESAFCLTEYIMCFVCFSE